MGRLALLAEDDPDDRKEIAGILTELGFTVVFASDSDETLDCVASLPFPDLVVLDWFIEGQEAGDGPAQGIVKTILRCSFAPLALITHDLTHAHDNMPKEFPSDFYVCYEKQNLKKVLSDVEAWSKTRQFLLPHG